MNKNQHHFTVDLAPFAAKRSCGRYYPEEKHPFRSAFQRDRDRIIHARAFRRLEYKTQVFVNGTADHYRTRLTHTMEMAAIGRNIARVLEVNEDLTETIALAHDIGHSPFGHCGERELNKLMADHGGFDHNIQSCRAVELLETRYPEFNGLNLTWEVRVGLRKHQCSTPGISLDGIPFGPHPFIEAQISDIADDISYHAADTDDGLEAGLLTPERLTKLELWSCALSHARKLHGNNMSTEQEVTAAIRALLDLQVTDVLNQSRQQLSSLKPGSPGAVASAPRRIIDFSPAMHQMLAPFRDMLFKEVYWHSEVLRSNEESVRLMRRLFLYYLEKPEAMGRKARARIASEGLHRSACDYIAGMTDRYALEEHQRFIG